MVERILPFRTDKMVGERLEEGDEIEIVFSDSIVTATVTSKEPPERQYRKCPKCGAGEYIRWEEKKFHDQ